MNRQALIPAIQKSIAAEEIRSVLPEMTRYRTTQPLSSLRRPLIKSVALSSIVERTTTRYLKTKKNEAKDLLRNGSDANSLRTAEDQNERARRQPTNSGAEDFIARRLSYRCRNITLRRNLLIGACRADH